ncbi:MAG: polysaccharide pyruvyl transferase CsaB [Clostridia bacterium]|nr:polysaccharide pyruvyl transferase CsaB [Clostridia bacterium]
MGKKKARPVCITIGGYYGYGNVGDEAVLYSILSSVAKKLPGIRVYVLTRDPCTIPAVEGIQVVAKSRRSPFSVISAFLLSQVYISGGGSLFQDRTSKKSLAYYCALVRLAKIFGCRVSILSNGMGPLKNESLCKRALSCADFVSLRDRDSLLLAKRLMVKGASPVLSADPVFAYPFRDELPRSFTIPAEPFFAVSLRPDAKGERLNVDAAAKAFITLRERGMSPVFVSMQDSFDLSLAREMAKKTGGRVVQPRDANELFALLCKAELAIGMRLHFLICAAMAGTVPVPVVYDPKVEGCMRDIGLSCSLFGVSPTAEEILQAVDEAKSSYSAKAVKNACRTARKKAIFDMECAVSFPEGAEEGEGKKFFADT